LRGTIMSSQLRHATF